jgi:hypothetical protein
VISGGQTGVDRAALRAARACGLEIGGWCPPGRESEDGTIPADLPLVETPRERSPEAPEVPRSQRTEWNLRDADATLVLRPSTRGDSDDPGTAWAVRCAARFERPLLVVDPSRPGAADDIAAWLSMRRPVTLGVGGPSEGTAPGIGEQAERLLVEVFRRQRVAGGEPRFVSKGPRRK